MFIPIEGAYSVAIREDDGLLDLALSKNVILMTPLTLSALRTANNLCKRMKIRMPMLRRLLDCRSHL